MHVFKCGSGDLQGQGHRIRHTPYDVRRTTDARIAVSSKQYGVNTAIYIKHYALFVMSEQAQG